MKKSIILRLKGGLGNQMFQCATGLTLSQETNRELVIDLSNYRNYKRPYFLDKFKVINQFKTINSKNKKNWLNQLTQRVYREKSFYYNKNFLIEAKECDALDGYFQSAKYFSNIKNRLQTLFALNYPIDGVLKKNQAMITSETISISLHVRRGDYLTKKNKKVHMILPIEYYVRAAKLLIDIYGNHVKFFLFSDDQDYLINNFNWLENKKIISMINNKPYEEMLLMASCTHHIIANSSFSWWGAWLNPNKSKTIIAPYYWFSVNKQKEISPQDVYEDNWIILK